MSTKPICWAALVYAALALPATGSAADDVDWQPVPPPPPPSAGVVPVTPEPSPAAAPAPASGISSAAFLDPFLGSSSSEPSPLIRTQAVEPALPPPPPPGIGPGVPYNSGLDPEKPLCHSWWDKCKEFFHGMNPCNSCENRNIFMSDHCFDMMASPITNPFLFLDPRALTEVRPIFMYGAAPRNNPIFRGGNYEFFGTQASVAVTNRFSFIINELGGVSLNPNNPIDGFSQDTGFAQMLFTPQFTFYRCVESRTIAATGLIITAPIGSARVFQNTGDLGLDPYVTGAHNFRLPSGYGSLNLMGSTGYNFSTDNIRSQFLHASLHLDYNILNANKYFPTLEMHYFYYAKQGTYSPPLGFEGLDIANFGTSNVGSRSYLSIAPGFRWMVAGRQNVQVGIAAEWPLLQQKEINDFRLTLDLIIRY